MYPEQIISGFTLSIDQGVAIKLGIDAAFIYNHIIYWLKLNARKPDAEMIEDKYWMYETQKEMAEFFGFMDEDRVCRALKKLEESNLIIRKNLSKNPFNRTYYYTLTDQQLIKKSLRNPPICGMHTPQFAESETPQFAESIYNDTTEEKQKKQQHPPVAVSSKKPKQKTQPEPVIHSHMRGLDPNLVPLEDQIWICANYSEEIVKHAIEWATHPETKLNKSMAAAIKWACQKKPEIPVSKKDSYEENKEYAKKYDGKTVKNTEITVLSKHVEFIYSGCSYQVITVSYDDKNFMNIFQHHLRKEGFKVE